MFVEKSLALPRSAKYCHLLYLNLHPTVVDEHNKKVEKNKKLDGVGSVENRPSTD